ncbi:MAG TPA: prolyl oligopeptidase family serine peptidase [Bacteroidales bacterium]|nr:prolyl oligopeptidase family serine peptidase [Bacteroidales bacterium]
MTQNIIMQEIRDVIRLRYSVVKMSLLIILMVNTLKPINAQQIEQQSVIETDYLIYFPPGYDAESDKKWPMLIYLHGAGLMDRSIAGLKNDCLPYYLGHDLVLPFIVASPVCKTNGWNVTILNFLLEDILDKFNIDEDKIYITGHSMGGFGTWDWAMMNPEKFAAIVPVSGCSNSRDNISAWKLRNMSIWVFHGETDNIVGIQCNNEMVDELRKFSQKVKFTVYPKRGHDTWEQTYKNEDMFKWLIEQDRRNNVPVPVNLDKRIFINYSGQYLFDRDTLKIGYTGDKQYLQLPNGKQINLLPESEFIFSFEENPFVGIMFQKEQDKITGFIILDKSKRFATRIN